MQPPSGEGKILAYVRFHFAVEGDRMTVRMRLRMGLAPTSVQQLMGEPNCSDPLMHDITEQYLHRRFTPPLSVGIQKLCWLPRTTCMQLCLHKSHITPAYFCKHKMQPSTRLNLFQRYQFSGFFAQLWCRRNFLCTCSGRQGEGV